MVARRSPSLARAVSTETEGLCLRINYTKVAPEALKALAALQAYVSSTSIPHSLQELIKIRASQINGCAFCLDMHTKDARAAGETEQRIYALSAWKETPFFSPSERAALAWTEALTRIADNDVPDELYSQVCEHFSEREVVELTLVIIMINSWNRLAISMRAEPGSYRPDLAR